LTGTGDISGQDPQLGNLTDNGGSTQTMALLAGSPAINTGDDGTCEATDQRGQPRPQGNHCDMGAYEAFPTFLSVAEQDGWLLETSETSNLGGTLNKNSTTLRVGDDAANKQYRTILSFDTTSLPDNAVITSATLRLKSAGISGTNPFSTHGKLLADICLGSFKSDEALQLGDFKVACSRNKALAFTDAKVNNWYSQLLNPDDFQYINLGGLTQFRLRFAKDDNNDFGADFLKIFSGNADTSNDPQLVIEYYVP